MDDCIEWDGTINSSGYGVKTVGSRTDGTRRIVRAHRLAYAEAHPEDDMEGRLVLHSCDNPPCVNPDHLRLGDHADNARDMLERRRHWNQAKGRCKHGHEFDDENTYWHNGQRHCRPCRASYQRQLRVKRKE